MVNWREVRKHLYMPVIVEFLDHALNLGPVKCRALGYLYKVERKYIKLVYWDLNHPSSEVRENNMEYCTLIRNAVIDVIPLNKADKFGNL